VQLLNFISDAVVYSRSVIVRRTMYFIVFRDKYTTSQIKVTFIANSIEQSPS
jgi:hypothetical protein